MPSIWKLVLKKFLVTSGEARVTSLSTSMVATLFRCVSNRQEEIKSSGYYSFNDFPPLIFYDAHIKSVKPIGLVSLGHWIDLFV